MLLIALLTPLCWLGILLIVFQLRKRLPPDPSLDGMFDAATRYAWVGGVFLAMLLNSTLAGLGVPPFAVNEEKSQSAAPTPTAFTLDFPTPETAFQDDIPDLESLSDAELMALIERGEQPWLVWEESYRQVIAGGMVIPGDKIAVDLSVFPRPAGDNGRGIHWIPTTAQSPAVVDRFVPEAQAMNIRWVVFLNGLNDWDWQANDYLVQRLTAAGIEPVMRFAAPVAPLDLGRVQKITRHYRAMGVRYYQIYNEPNLYEEWAEEGTRSPERFADLWAEGAAAVLAEGGLPGLAAMSPGGNMSDYVYLSRVLGRLLATQRYDLLNRAWLSVHNYTGGAPADFTGDPTGFGRYRRYAEICRAVLGAPLPMLGTEGGPAPANGVWTSQAGEREEAAWIVQAYHFMQSRREPWFLVYSPWLLANAAGGGDDPRWEAAAWFQLDGPRQVVEAVREL